MMKFKTIHSSADKKRIWKYVKIAGIGLLAIHTLHRRSVNKKLKKQLESGNLSK